MCISAHLNNQALHDSEKMYNSHYKVQDSKRFVFIVNTHK